jgi:hypothetical protein
VEDQVADRSGFTEYVEEHADRLLRTAYLLTRNRPRCRTVPAPLMIRTRCGTRLARLSPRQRSLADLPDIAAQAGGLDGAWAVGVYDRRQ